MLANHPYDVVNKVPMSKWDTVNGSTVYLVHTKHEFLAFFELLMSKKRVFFDTETTGFNMFSGDRIVGSSFGWGSTHFYIPCRHVDSVTGGRQPDQLEMDWLRPYYQEFFAQEDVEIVGYNTKFDEKFYYVDDIIIKCKRHDGRILWHLYDENAPGALKVVASGWKDDLGRWNPGIVDSSANLNEKEISAWRTDESKARKKELSKAVMAAATEMKCEPRFQGWKRNDIKKYLKEEYFKDHIYAKSSKEDIHYGYIPIQLLAPYAGVDTYLTECVFDYVMENMEWNDKLRALYENEMELSAVIMGAEIAGVRMDREYLAKMSLDYGVKIAKLHEIIQETLVPKRVISDPDGTLREETAEEHKARWINLGSTDQLAKALVDHGVDLTLRSKKTDKLLLDKKILVKAGRKHDIVASILELRKIDKIKSTYFDSILAKLREDNILHASFNQNVSTGRMSSQDPNLQNIVRGEAVRNAFIALNEDYIYVLADYSQVEVRLTAHFSGDPILVDAYRNKQDVHCRTSGQMFGVPYEEMIAAKESKDKSNPRIIELNDYRNIGKCVSPKTIIWMPNGRPITLESLGLAKTKDTFLDIEGVEVSTGLGTFTDVNATYNNGPGKRVIVVTYGGVLIASENHQFAMQDGRLIRAADLTEGDLLQEVDVPKIKYNYDFIDVHPVIVEKTKLPLMSMKTNMELAYLAGVFIGDGSASESSVTITAGSRNRNQEFCDWRDSLIQSVEAAGFTATDTQSGNNGIYLGSRAVYRTFEALDLVIPLDEISTNNTRKIHHIPIWVLAAGEYAILTFIGGLIDSDGAVGTNGSIDITTKYPELASQLASVCAGLGIQVTVEPSYNKPYDRYYYRLFIAKKSNERLLPFIKHPKKRQRLLDSPCVNATYRRKNAFQVRKILIEESGDLADLNVSCDDHMYLTGNFRTHNTLNFALIYGVSPQGLSEQIPRPAMYKHLSDDQWVYKCEDFMKSYFRTHLGVKRFINKYSRLVADQGYIENYFGRIRHLPHAKATEITGDNSLFWLEQKAKRQGVNFLVQGTAGDVFKIAVVRVANILKGSKSFIISFVHDEIQMYIHKQDIHLLNPIKKAMEDFNFRVPLTVEMDYSLTSWGAKKAIKH